MKKILLGTLTLITFGVNAQNVNIPDANFKAYLVGESSINTNADAEIQISEASAFTGTINCSNLNISDLTGIEAFSSLTFLYVNDNNLSSVDLSQNTALVRLICPNNNLNSLDLSSNTNLEFLSCGDNVLTSLNVANGNNVNFTVFVANNNPNLTCIEVDDVAYSTTNWKNFVDSTASFSLNCSTVSINEQFSNVSLIMYPNPTSDQLTIELGEKLESIVISNISGKVVKYYVPNNNTVNVSDLTKGVYFLQLQTTEGLISKKFIKK